MAEEIEVRGPTDVFIDALVAACMTHAGNAGGAVDYPTAAAGMIRVLAEMIGPQEPNVRQAMLADFSRQLAAMVNVVALRQSVMESAAGQTQN